MIWYLAARFGRKEELLEYQLALQDAGEQVNARWLVEESDMRLVDHEERERIAIMDAEDVTKSDGVICFTEEPQDHPAGSNRGGRHVEFGLALALNKRVVVVGPRENVFCYLPNIEVFPDFQTFMEEGL